MPRLSGRLVSMLLPPAAGVACYLISSGGTVHSLLPSPHSTIGEEEKPREAASDKLKSLSQTEAAPLRAFAARIAAAPDLPSLTMLWMETHATFPDDLEKKWLSGQIFDRMIAMDPIAGLAWVRSFSLEAQPHPGTDFQARWALVDPQAAGAAVLSGPGDPDTALYLMAMALAKADPRRFLKEGLPENWNLNDSRKGGFDLAALSALSETDLAGALELAPPYLSEDHYELIGLMKKLAGSMQLERGAAGALEWVKGLTDWPDTMRQRLQTELLPGLALENPARAALEYDQIRSINNKETGIKIAGIWAAKDPAAALAWTATSDAGPSSYDAAEIMTEVIPEIGRVIGADSAKLLLAVRGLPENSSSFRFSLLFQSFGAQDLAVLTTELATASPSPHQANLIAGSLARWTRQDSPAALRAIAELPPQFAGPARDALLENLGASGIAKLPLDDQMAFIRQLQTDPALAPAMERSGYGYLIEGVARRDPAEAVELLQSSPGPLMADTWSRIFRRWVSSHPAVAAERVLTLPEDQHGPAVAGLVSGWAGYDPMAASIWSSLLPQGPGRDQAAASLAEALDSVEPASAFTWAASIGNEETGQPVLERTLQSWISRDATAARLALENSALPDTRKADLRNLFPEVVR